MVISEKPSAVSALTRVCFAFFPVWAQNMRACKLALPDPKVCSGGVLAVSDRPHHEPGSAPGWQLWLGTGAALAAQMVLSQRPPSQHRHAACAADDLPACPAPLSPRTLSVQGLLLFQKWSP